MATSYSDSLIFHLMILLNNSTILEIARETEQVQI
jgi:hypothetical protein